MGVICVSNLLPGIGTISFLKQSYIGQLGFKYLYRYGFTTVWVNGFGELSLQPNKHHIVYYIVQCMSWQRTVTAYKLGLGLPWAVLAGHSIFSLALPGNGWMVVVGAVGIPGLRFFLSWSLLK